MAMSETYLFQVVIYNLTNQERRYLSSQSVLFEGNGTKINLDGHQGVIYSTELEVADIDPVAKILGNFLYRFRPNNFIALEYGIRRDDGSRGGGVAFITATNIAWVSTEQMIDSYVRQEGHRGQSQLTI
jgi:hypothetical protein